MEDEEEEIEIFCSNCGNPVGSDVELECEGCSQEVCDSCYDNHNTVSGKLCPESKVVKKPAVSDTI